MAKPPISVLIDTYNHERFIEKAITSVLEQDFPASDREIIVIDDGSTDRTPEIVRQFAPHIRCLRKVNGGQASAFNAGIPECKGDIIAFLDGDDYWLPGKLRRVVEILAKNPAVGLVGHAIEELLPDGSRRSMAPEKDERFRLDTVAAARVFRLRRSYLGTSRMTLRAEVARRILPVPEALVFEADEYLFTLAAAMSEVMILREPLTCYVIHGNNLYVSAGFGTAALQRKKDVMTTLAKRLNEKLREIALPEKVIHCVVEIVQADADILRLMSEGGFPWETFRAENKMFQVHHADAPALQRMFRTLSMIPALLLPPRWFYGVRNWLGTRNWYRNMRKTALPVPEITRVAGPEEFKI